MASLRAVLKRVAAIVETGVVGISIHTQRSIPFCVFISRLTQLAARAPSVLSRAIPLLCTAAPPMDKVAQSPARSFFLVESLLATAKF
jgi:hypothetical protein